MDVRYFCFTFVIGFAETKLMRSDANDKYALPGFGLPIRNDQHQSVVRTRPPHGLIVYVREGFVVDELSVFSTPDPIIIILLACIFKTGTRFESNSSLKSINLQLGALYRKTT
jgi:hypothetical protein